MRFYSMEKFGKMREAADALKLTAQHLKEIGVVDKIIKNL